MKKTLTFILLMLLAIPGGWYLFFGRALNAQSDLVKKEIAATEAKIAQFAAAMRNIEKHFDDYRRLNAVIADRQSSFSGRDEVVGLYRALDSLCHRRGYDKAEITPSLEQVIRFLREWARADSSVSIPISIRVEGSYRDLAELVAAVEQSPHFDHLDRCHLYGSERMAPRCGLDLTYVARLDNRMEFLDRE
jgi:Tfp pilus assembly protein PilO